MKKTISVALALLLALTLLAGCGQTAQPDDSSAVDTADTTTTTAESTTTTIEAETATTTTTKPTTSKPILKQTVTKTTTTTTKATTTTTKPTTTTTVPKVKTKVNITAIAGPTGVGLVSLMKQNTNKKAANDYTFNLVSDPTQAVAAITGKSADIAAVPTNLASTLYKKTGGNVQVLAVNTLGVLYMLENGTAIKTVKDLKGKTIYTSGQGANPEYILRYVLEKNGLDPDRDVRIEFVADNDALVAAVVTGQAEVAMVPEPKVTACLTQMKSAGKTPATVALNMTEEWHAVAGDTSALMMGCVIVRNDFAEKNPDAVKAFLTEYEASINAVKGNVDAAATLCETYKVIPKAAMAKQAIPRCNLTFVKGTEMKTKLAGYLQVLYGYNPAAIGGAMPADAFYYAG